MSKLKIPVFITAVGGGGVGEQILKALKIAQQDTPRYRFILGDMNPNTAQFSHADKAYQLPAAKDKAFVETVLQYCVDNDCKILFCGCEPDIKAISPHRHLFEDKGIIVALNPHHVIEQCMDKNACSLLLEKNGFTPPKFLQTRDVLIAEKIDWYPVIVKPATGSGGSAHCYIAQSKDELIALMGYLLICLPNQDFIIQEYVGTAESEYTVGVLMDMDGNYLNAIATHRFLKSQLNVRAKYPNRTERKDLGESLVISSGISHGHLARFPDITSQCRILAENIGARGAINIQLRYVDGKIKVFEINPRFSGTTSLRAMVGYNEPDILVRKHILGEDIKPDFPYKEATILRTLKEDIIE